MKRLIAFEAGICAIFLAVYLIAAHFGMEPGKAVFLGMCAPALLAVIYTRPDLETNVPPLWPFAVLAANYCFALVVLISSCILATLSLPFQMVTMCIAVIILCIFLFLSVLITAVAARKMKLAFSLVLPVVLVGGILVNLIWCLG